MTGLHCQNIPRVLVELPGVVLSTFAPVLENLENMQREARLPFRE
jgi:hypothetical protein